jgi:DNA polymerase-3 subunit alpha
MDIKEWLSSNSIKGEFVSDNVFTIKNVGTFLAVRDKDKILDEGLTLLLDEDEEGIEVDFYCFPFGCNWYYTKLIHLSDLKILKYTGEYDSILGVSFPFLGIHGGYDILNGSRVYADWIKKAKFLEIDTLGICEKNSLGGALKFQLKCQENKIRPIIGYQACVKSGEELSYVKCYAKDERGWQSLLNINKEVNVLNHGHISKTNFIESMEGLMIVLDPKLMLYKDTLPYQINVCKGDLFWQLDTVEFENDVKDKEYLLNVREYLNNKKEIPPVLICDAYYLDSTDFDSKIILNSIADRREFASRNQYFKSPDEIFGELIELFEDEDKVFEIFEQAVENTFRMADRCKFTIPIKQRLLPEYLMTKEEKEKFGDKNTLFYSIVEEGFKRKCPKGEEELYLARLDEEIKVIANNNFIDYFLILWDIIRWARDNDILVGAGRGSAAGSLLAYVMDLTQIDPIIYDLLFSRFLNEGRAKVSYPDIDSDIESSRREDVKKYMERKYGRDRVCSIGTYTNLKIKQALKDIARLSNVDFDTTNYISQVLDLEEGTWFDIFRTAVDKKRVKDFIMDHPSIIENIQLILNQPKSRSIHACAMLITPEGKSIYEWIPVRLENRDGEDILVSEWEGVELETAGFLKEDILGIKQLDKYRFILNLIKKDTGDVIDIYNIDLDDQVVLEMFRNGYNGDIFHFGSKGLTKYCKELKPLNINDLIAAISLFRPGAIENNFHNEYILRKDGEREVEYWTGAETVLEETYAVIVYQEQVMKLCQVLGGLTLVEADDVRRAMVKKKYDELHKYKERFLKFYPENFGVTDAYAEEVWDAIDKASSYLFNKSHAAAYAITGYIGQWLKCHYPLQYWTSAFQFDDPNPKKSNISRYIGEIRKSETSIRIKPPHINFSTATFASNAERNEIYWSINKVAQVGEKTFPAIIEERDKNGEFFSIQDFLDRVNRSLVNKGVILNLIFAGCFDEVEGVKNPEDRIEIVKKLAKSAKDIKVDEYPADRFWWSVKQREVSGFGEIDYTRLIRNSTDFKLNQLVGAMEVQDEENDRNRVVVAGIISLITVRVSKKNNEYCDIDLDSNNEIIRVRLWNEQYEQYKDELIVGKILIMNGQIQFYREEGSVQTHEDTIIKIF